MTQFLLTTLPGLERVVYDELTERANAAGIALRPLPARQSESERSERGRVWIEAETHAKTAVENCWGVLRQMRSICHVYQLLLRFELPPNPRLADVETALADFSQPGSVPGLAEAASFRVTARRNGEHAFGSEDLQRLLGALLKSQYHTPVSLKHPEFIVRLEVEDRRCLVLRQWTTESLHRRHDKAFQSGIALKSVLAYALLHWAGLTHPPTERRARLRLLDPFCGSGTLLLEAAELGPHLELYASDRHARMLTGTRVNLTLSPAAQNRQIYLQLLDARDLDLYWPEAYFSALVTDPPLGKQLGEHLDFDRLYQRLLDAAAFVLEDGGHLVLLVGRADELFRRHLQRHQAWRRLQRLRLDLGSYAPWAYVLQRLPR